MKTLKFKTNIKCAGCLSKVTAPLNEKVGHGNWEVDLMTLKKTLTVQVPTAVTHSEIVTTLNGVGFIAEPLE